MKVELFILPIAAFDDKLHFYVIDESASGLGESDSSSIKQTFPMIQLSEKRHTLQAIRAILQKDFAYDSHEEFDAWINTPRCHARIIDVYDRERLPEQKNSIAIVRAVSVPDNIALRYKASWHEAKHLLSADSKLSLDNKFFLKECLNLIPVWVKNTSFTFELMCRVFSIQELRLLVSMLSNQEIDPGNFHRRLKKLDILRPLGIGQQRVHRWEFAWERSVALSSDGLIP